MKKLILFSAVISILFSSCKKTEDLTTSIAGVYSGNLQVINVASGNSQTAAEQILVSRVDDSHVLISEIGGGDMPTFTADVLEAKNNDLLLRVQLQVVSGISIQPYIIYSADNQPCSGGYVHASRQINIIVYTNGTDIVAFQGTH